MKHLAAAFALLLGSATTAGGVEFRDADLHPLLRISVSLFVTPTTHPFVGAGHVDKLYVVTRGGALIAVETGQETFSAPFRSFYVRGVGSPAATATLRTKLGQYRIGLQASCSLEPDSGDPGSEEITWYGRGGRRTRFSVFYGEAGVGFPPCSSEVQEILNAIGEFQGTVILDPDSERLTSD